jgi:hypothetical protein
MSHNGFGGAVLGCLDMLSLVRLLLNIFLFTLIMKSAIPGCHRGYNLTLAGLSKRGELNGAASSIRVRAPVRSILLEIVSFSTPLEAISRAFDQCRSEPTTMLKEV